MSDSRGAAASVDDSSQRRDVLFLDELTDQFDRTRALLTDSPEEVAARALARMGGDQVVEARIAAALAMRAPLAQPDRFPEAHRLVMRALEVLDREGARDPRVPRLGPLAPLVELAVEFVAGYIVGSFAGTVVARLRNLSSVCRIAAAARWL